MGQNDPISFALLEGLHSKVFPGAVLLVRRSGKTLFHEGVGHFTFDAHSPPVHQRTIYDLASLTKPLATTSALLVLTQEKVVDLDQPLESVLQEAQGSAWGKVSMRALLSHQSGLPAWRGYYQNFSGTITVDAEVRQDRLKAYLNLILQESPEGFPPFSSVYSDLGFILLGLLIERVTKQSLGAFCQERLFGPLECGPLFFGGPMETVSPTTVNIAPTQEDPWREKLLQGEVDDANAAALGGVAGHAGLFGTAEAVGKMTQAWLEGYLGKPGLFDSQLVHEWVTRHEGTSWALGWDTPSQPSSSGRWFSPESFGHLGFTGTSLWIDPTRELEVIFLSNRVYPTGKNEAIKAFRPQLHDVIIKTFF